jgi:hypothetical protein
MTDEVEDDSTLISSLWASWVCTVCDWQKIPHPTSVEWVVLKRKFHLDKAPIDSVAELKQLRSKT